MVSREWRVASGEGRVGGEAREGVLFFSRHSPLYPLSMIRRVCVFCGSKMGVAPAFRESAAALGA